MHYLDYAASAPRRDEVTEAMMPWMHGTIGNPSGHHRAAREANRCERARDEAVRRGAPPDEVARLDARNNMAQRASGEAERLRERANDAPARLACLRAQQARLQRQPGAGPVQTTGRAVI